MLKRKFRCGRLQINQDGTVKKVELAEGGGTRDCTISHIDMGFNEIHDVLCEVFSLDPRSHNSKLYDFERKELDTNRYHTFLEYVTKNGLKFNGTLLYLCTSAGNRRTFTSTSSDKRTTTRITTSHPVQVQTPPRPIRKVPQVEADSSTSPALIKIDDSPPIHRRSHDESVLSSRICENLRISSFSNYSFDKSLNEIIDFIRHLLTQYNHETILVQLFEHICTIHGLSLITLDQLKQQIQSINEQQKLVYNDAIDKIDQLCRSIKASLELNKMKISHIDRQALITKLFHQFHQNFNILRDQWNNKINNDRQTIYISSTNSSTDPVPSSRRHSHKNSRKPSRSPPRSSSGQHKNSRKPSRSPSRSSSGQHKNSQKRSRSPPRSSSGQHHNESFSLFKNLLKSLDHLSDVLCHLRYSQFYQLVRSIINDIELFRSSINLSDNQSLENARQLIISIESSLTNRINDEYRRSSPYKINHQLETSCNNFLESIKCFLSALQHYQDQINKNKRQRRTRWSSPPPEESFENKPDITFDERHIKFEDDSNSDASRSSFGDEVLMEVAKHAYEQRPDRFK